MLPAVAIVGRPNVGKSTLFNQLTRTKDALVADQPGLTRDRQYGVARKGGTPFIVVDTGGFWEGGNVLSRKMVEQAKLAEVQADTVVFMVDAREGLSPLDEQITQRLRKLDKPVVLAINKVDGVDWPLIIRA